MIKYYSLIKRYFDWLLRWSIGITLLSLVTSCSLTSRSSNPITLNGRYNNQQPALSGDGNWLALVSDRTRTPQLILYNLTEQRFVDLPQVNLDNVVAESPSLSRTGRYLVYISSLEGRPDIILYDRITEQMEILTQGYRSWIRRPKISADGRYIVFETSRRGQWDIEVIDRGPAIELDILNGTPVKPPGQ